MAKLLDDRIAAAMSKDARIATVAALIDEVADEITSVQGEHDRQDALSKSATATEDEADRAADEAAKLARKIIRLQAKREQLTQRHADIVESERQKKLRAEYDGIKSRRDGLAAELTEKWPLLTDEIVGLLRRLQESDRECYAINRQRVGEHLCSAEAVARDCSPVFSSVAGPVTRFYAARIPTLSGRGLEEMAWPLSSAQLQTAIPIP